MQTRLHKELKISTMDLMTFLAVYFRKYIPDPQTPQLSSDFNSWLHEGADRATQFKAVSAVTESREADWIDSKVFWEMNTFEYPSLSKFAVFLLTAKPQSATCERLFSSYGLLKTNKRNRMKDSCMITTARVQRFLKKRNKMKLTKGICRLTTSEEYSVLATGRSELDMLEYSTSSSENAVEPSLIEPGHRLVSDSIALSPEASEASDSDCVEDAPLTEDKNIESQWPLQEVAAEEEVDIICEELEHQSISAETPLPEISIQSPVETLDGIRAKRIPFSKLFCLWAKD